MKKTILILVLLVIGLTNKTFSQFSNGSFADTINKISSPSGFLDNVFDQYGNQYTLSDITIGNTRTGADGIQRSSTLLCTCGYYNLYFETGCGMEGNDATSTSRRNVVCQVFSDISAFIISPLTLSGNKVNIWVRDISQLVTNPQSSLVLGGAIPF